MLHTLFWISLRSDRKCDGKAATGDCKIFDRDRTAAECNKHPKSVDVLDSEYRLTHLLVKSEQLTLRHYGLINYLRQQKNIPVNCR